MKKVLIAISIAVLIPAFLFLFLFFMNKNNIVDEEEKTVVSSKNKQLPIADYRKTAEKIIDDKDAVIKSNDSYEIMGSFYNNKNSFIIFIKNSNFEKTRQDAETYLLTILGITRDEACSLEVSVVVSPDVDENLNDNYGLSFCPNAKSFK
jgi:preprotein translocase subunit SecF